MIDYKIGDFVRDTRFGGIFTVDGLFETGVVLENGVRLYCYEIEPWIPKENEWGWMWDSTDNLQLRRFGDKTIVRPFTHYEPFIGEFPTPVKGNKNGN